MSIFKRIFGLDNREELHAHLNGSLSRTTLKSLGCLDNSISEYQTETTDIQQVFDLFKVAHKATGTIENVYIATQNVIQEFAADNVVYLELRTTPRSEAGMTQERYIETVINAIRDCQQKNIVVKLLLSIDRRKSYEEQIETLQSIIRYKNEFPNIVKGVDLSGDPAKGQFFSELFEKARLAGLRTAIHCAEIKNDAEVKSIISFKPDRIGHGTCIHPHYGGNAEIWEEYKLAQIPVECCLTSNVVCLTSKSYDEHHLKEWIKETLPFCLGTDDKGVFNTTLSKEFYMAHRAFNLSALDLWAISRKSLEYAFANDEEKEALRQLLDLWKSENLPKSF